MTRLKWWLRIVGGLYLLWVLLGIFMLIFSRFPARARVLVMVAAAWELLVWLPVDLMGLFNGFAVPRAVTLIVIHIVIGTTGLLLLRQGQTDA